MENNVVPINKATLTQQVESGMKKKELALHYGISMNQMTKALQACGLQIKKNHYPKFEIVEDEQVVDTPQVIVDNTPKTPTAQESIQEDKAQDDAPVDQVDNEENDNQEVAPQPEDNEENKSSNNDWV